MPRLYKLSILIYAVFRHRSPALTSELKELRKLDVPASPHTFASCLQSLSRHYKFGKPMTDTTCTKAIVDAILQNLHRRRLLTYRMA